LFNPKKRRPFHFVPVTSLAIALRELKRRPSHSKPLSSTVTTMLRFLNSLTRMLPGIGTRES